MTLWSWFWNKCLLIYQYLLIKYKGLQFDYDAKHAMKQKTNRQTLFKILKHNRNTKFLTDQYKKVDLVPDEHVENFRKVFPNYTEYSDYESYVNEIRNNGHAKDILSVGYPIALTSTSGTSGTPKNFPVYSLDINEAYAICYRLTQSVRSNLFTGGKAITLNSLRYGTHLTADKLKSYPLSAITAIAAGEKQNVETIMKFNHDAVPSIIPEKICQQTDLYLFMLIWALQCEDLETISSTFVMAMIHFFTHMEENFDFLCKHIELMRNDTEMANKILTCYCAGDRDLSRVEVQCCLCLRFCHQDCISFSTGPMLPFMTNYQFLCRDCSQNKTDEQFIKKTATFNQLCITALANLTQQSTSHTFFSRDREILPFIDEKWDLLTFSQKKNKPTLHASVYKALGREDLFVASDIGGEIMIALREQSLEKIGPMNEKIFEIMNPNACRAQSPSTTNPFLAFSNSTPLQTSQSGNGTFHGSSSTNSVSSLANSEVTRRTSKRKLANENSINSKRRGDAPKLERPIPKSFPAEYPFNKEGYRYHLAEPDPHSPFRQKFDETEVWAGKPIPGHLYRTFLENECLLSLNDRAQQLKLNDDRLTVTGDKGYCSVRSTHCATHGAWYYEVTITSMPPNTAARIGWAQHLANLQTPIGTDKFGYSWRSRKGTTFHEASGLHYSNDGYGENDVLGFLIILPENTPPDVMLPRKYKKLPLVKFKTYIYFEERDDLRTGEMNLKPTNGGKIIFYKNGVNQGVAFTNIYEGNYYAAISLYYGATVSANFGPSFVHPPTDSSVPWKPLTESIPETYCTHALNDLLFHISHDEQNIDLNDPTAMGKNSARNAIRERCRRLTTLSAPIFE